MNLQKILLALLASSFLAVSSVSAQVSIGAGFANYKLDDNGFDAGVSGAAIDVTGRINKHFGYSVAAQFSGDDGFLELDHFFAGKLRGGIEVGEGFLFLSAGYGRASWSNKGIGFDFDVDVGLLGGGYEIFFGKEKKWGAGIEFSTGSGIRQTMGTVRYRF